MIAPVLENARLAQPLVGRLWRQLRLVERLLLDHRAAAVARFGAVALETIDLPSLSAPQEMQPEQIRAAGALLWARELEEAGLPGFVDSMADLVLQGKFLLPITTAVDKLMLYRRARTERFAPGERRAIYERVFGDDFESSWTALLKALDVIAHVGTTENLSAPTARLVAAAREVGMYLSQRTGGIVAFAASSIAQQVREALAVLKSPDLVQALGDGSVWQMIRLHAPMVLGRALQPEPHLDRAAGALRITGWLADAAAAIEAGVAQLPSPEALEAAELWLASGEAA
jgi:hypothetical protein